MASVASELAGSQQDLQRAGGGRQRDPPPSAQVLLLWPERGLQRSSPAQSALCAGVTWVLVSLVIVCACMGGVHTDGMLCFQFLQARDDILNGSHPVSFEKACEFGGIQAQIQFGPHIEHKHKSGFLEWAAHPINNNIWKSLLPVFISASAGFTFAAWKSFCPKSTSSREEPRRKYSRCVHTV